VNVSGHNARFPCPSYTTDRDPPAVPLTHPFQSEWQNDRPSVGSAAWLLGNAEAICLISANPITANAAMSLRREHGPEAASLLLTIASVQSRAMEKFGPGTWMATEKSIAQATDRVVAAYKASLFDNAPVFDLCSGIGGDAMQLARRGPVVAVDIDPQIVAMAAANLAIDSANRGGADVSAEAVCGDATQFVIPPDAGIHIDPDRRPRGTSRVVQPSSYKPSIDEVAHLIAGGRPAIIKLAPAAQLDHDADSELGHRLVCENHRQWISMDGSVREQALFCGSCISSAGVTVGGRSAVRVWGNGHRELFSIDANSTSQLAESDRALETIVEVPRYLIDVDPAVRAAGLSSSIATARGWSSLGGPAGFLCCNTLPSDQSLAQVFEAIWSGPADMKRIKRWVQDQGLWVESVKVRGTGQDPAQWTKALRSDLSAKGSGHVVVLIGRHSRGVYAAITQRSDAPNAGERIAVRH
jgi:hypothetical protein